MSFPTELADLRSRASEILAEIDELAALDNPTDEEIDRLRAGTNEAERIRAQIVALETEHDAKVERIRDHARAGHTEDGVGTFNYVPSTELWGRSLNRRQYSPEQIRNTALRCNEQVKGELVEPEDRERIEKLLRSDKTGEDGIYVQAVSNPAYRGAFTKYLQHGDRAGMFFTEEERGAMARAEEVRAMNEGSNSAGLALVPFALDPTIVLTNAGTYPNTIRGISRVETVNTSAGHYVTSAGVSAEWVSEASEATDASPTFTQVTITPVRADAYCVASYELVQDSNVDSQLGRVFQDAKQRLEETAFATGSGSTQPFGIVTRLAATTASRVAAQTNASFGSIDCFALDNALPARHQPNASWLGPKFIYNLARQFGGPQQPSFWVDLGAQIPSLLLGHPTYLSSAITNAGGGTTSLSTATASNDDILVLGDFSNFVIVDRIGMSVTVNQMVVGSNQRPTGQMGFLAFWRVSSDSLNNDAFRLLRI